MKKLLLIGAAIFMMGASPYLPDPQLTPGAINTEITQSNIGDNICKHGWSTKSIRPSSNYTDKLKAQQLKSDPRYKDNMKMSNYEEDHLISLEIGGNPTDPKNLWPQPYFGVCNAHLKDRLENKLHELVCSGTITLQQAQQKISTNWVDAYNQYVDPLNCQ